MKLHRMSDTQTAIRPQGRLKDQLISHQRPTGTNHQVRGNEL